MAVTIKDVAKKAGVSVATVSRVVNQKDIHKVGPRTQKKIEKILKEMGYYPNTMARGLKTRRTYNIGVVFFWYDKPHLSDFYLTRLLDGVFNFLSEKRYNILMNTFSREMGTEGVYSSFVNSGLVDGILAIAPPLNSRFFMDLKGRQLPFVLVNYQVNDRDISFVDCLNTQGILDLVDHLLELGHKRIAFISGDIEFSKNALDRFNAFQYAAKKRGLPFSEELVYQGNWTPDAGAEAVRKFLKAKPRPTAVMASTDLMAMGAIRELRAQGLRVPQDVAVTGFDDLPLSGLGDFPITTVHQPLFDMGVAATQMLLDRIEKRPIEYNHRLFPTKLIIRESCGYYLKNKTVSP